MKPNFITFFKIFCKIFFAILYREKTKSLYLMTVFDALAGTKILTVILSEQGLIHISQINLISLFNYELSNTRRRVNC